MPLVILLYFLWAQHVPTINMPIIRSSSLSLQPGHNSSLTAPTSNIQQTKNDTTSVVINIIVASS